MQRIHGRWEYTLHANKEAPHDMRFLAEGLSLAEAPTTRRLVEAFQERTTHFPAEAAPQAEGMGTRVGAIICPAKLLPSPKNPFSQKSKVVLGTKSSLEQRTKNKIDMF